MHILRSNAQTADKCMGRIKNGLKAEIRGSFRGGKQIHENIKKLRCKHNKNKKGFVKITIVLIDNACQESFLLL